MGQALEFSSDYEVESEKFYCPLCYQVHFWSNICVEMLEYSGILDWLDEPDLM